MQELMNDRSSAERLAAGLGWFSLGLGLAELAAPRQVARLIGLPEEGRHVNVLRVMGAREIAAGLGILAVRNRAPGMWARVAGDGLDLALLGAAMNRDDARRTQTMGAAAAVTGVAIADWLCARALPSHRSGAIPGELSRTNDAHVECAVTINRPRHEVYAFWRNVENFPRFMAHVESVRVLDATRSRWRAAAPAGFTVEWEAEIVSERENDRIAWRSVSGSGIQNRGTVTFLPAPGGRGTEVRVAIDYVPPAGTVGRMVARLFGEEPGQQVREDLRRFKQLLETGEIAMSDGQGMWRAAQPPVRAEQVKRRARVTL